MIGADFDFAIDPANEKILFNIFEWNEETDSDDFTLIILDFNEDFQSFSFPTLHKDTLKEKTFKIWAGGNFWYDSGDVVKLVEIKRDRYVSFFEYLHDDEFVVLFDSITNA